MEKVIIKTVEQFFEVLELKKKLWLLDFGLKLERVGLRNQARRLKEDENLWDLNSCECPEVEIQQEVETEVIEHYKKKAGVSAALAFMPAMTALDSVRKKIYFANIDGSTSSEKGVVYLVSDHGGSTVVVNGCDFSIAKDIAMQILCRDLLKWDSPFDIRRQGAKIVAMLRNDRRKRGSLICVGKKDWPKWKNYVPGHLFQQSY